MHLCYVMLDQSPAEEVRVWGKGASPLVASLLAGIARVVQAAAGFAVLHARSWLVFPVTLVGPGQRYLVSERLTGQHPRAVQ